MSPKRKSLRFVVGKGREKIFFLIFLAVWRIVCIFAAENEPHRQ
jgi:hypothetical protein